MYSYRPQHKAGQKQDDQLEHTFSSYVRIRVVALKTCQRWWNIEKTGMSSKRVSLHMHVVLHTLLLLWVNPKHCSCLFVCFIFSCPPDRILVVARNVRYPSRTTSWSPAGQEVEWFEKEGECVWGQGRNVTTSLE